MVDVIFDYAKIATCVEDRRAMFKAAFRAAGFALRNGGRAFLLYCLLVTISLALLLGYWALSRQWRSDSSWAIVGLFAVQQLYLLGRTAMRLLFYSSQMALYRALTPPPVSLSYYDAEED